MDKMLGKFVGTFKGFFKNALDKMFGNKEMRVRRKYDALRLGEPQVPTCGARAYMDGDPNPRSSC